MESEACPAIAAASTTTTTTAAAGLGLAPPPLAFARPVSVPSMLSHHLSHSPWRSISQRYRSRRLPSSPPHFLILFPFMSTPLPARVYRSSVEEVRNHERCATSTLYSLTPPTSFIHVNGSMRNWPTLTPSSQHERIPMIKWTIMKRMFLSKRSIWPPATLPLHGTVKIPDIVFTWVSTSITFGKNSTHPIYKLPFAFDDVPLMTITVFKFITRIKMFKDSDLSVSRFWALALQIPSIDRYISWYDFCILLRRCWTPIPGFLKPFPYLAALIAQDLCHQGDVPTTYISVDEAHTFLVDFLIVSDSNKPWTILCLFTSYKPCTIKCALC